MSPLPAPLSSADSATLEQVRRLARQLDTSIRLPGGLRIGWDAVLGLVPAVGDWAGALLSSYIVLQAARLGASREVLLRMVGNVAVEALVGAVPFLGDVFDAAWRANVRNVRLLENHLAAPTATQRASQAWVLGVVLLLVALMALAMTLAVLTWSALASWVSQT
ncbi:DUF4112 domain-containing protein [Stigmatella aurantiaca]|uniref:DUF4112 domain-containing protein n=1 Tax=Stigmatella aurantiaca (strain DW4/3-1) TaxID=378806 RepID=Q09D06_STIAD|nr:DUF4112 domain-containing protein [Stigmatella aurantiaca]ADO67909.1 uncharacterized protein STAUR_0100 [Stigmatella aurantiaca DW4/3-1]EAU69614.1 conserved hypothetical protein [Stigmatella aurantiaca DW4/3-1]